MINFVLFQILFDPVSIGQNILKVMDPLELIDESLKMRDDYRDPYPCLLTIIYFFNKNLLKPKIPFF
jgi:hypothetical protein